MDTKALRQKILDLAIHGKLVPQDPNDEPASVLLERIRAEKERLIKKGKIKKGKKSAKTSDKPHYENEEPFEVPNSWEWCKLGTVNEIARGGSPRPIKDYLTTDANGINWIKIGDTTKDGKYIDSVKEKIRHEGVKKSRLVHKGDFLLTNSMSFGRPYILNVDGCIHDGWLVISPIGEAYTSDFLYYLLSSSFAFEQFTNVASGGVVTNLNSDKVADAIFPLPPYGEQKRIVFEIERCFALIDVIELRKTDLRETIKQAKSKVLDLAIHGKLVPQDPNDEPASELLKRINPKAEIITDNGHYQKLPEGWCICHINEISESLLGKTLDRTKDSGEFKRYVCAVNVQWGYFDFTTQKEFRIEAKDFERYAVKKGDLLICEGGDVGRCAIWDTDTEMYYQNALHRVRCKLGISEKYLQYSLWHFKLNGVIDSLCKGVTIKHFTQSTMNKLEIPLPPFAEQQRIVAKIEELFHQLDIIEESL
mgnify:FL=1